MNTFSSYFFLYILIFFCIKNKKTLMKRFKTSKTIAQVLSEIDTLDKKCKRIAQVLGYRSSEIPKTYRQFISLCNSISIVFLQFNLHHQAFHVLSRCVQCDVSMFFEGSIEDRT